MNSTAQRKPRQVRPDVAGERAAAGRFPPAWHRHSASALGTLDTANPSRRAAALGHQAQARAHGEDLDLVRRFAHRVRTLLGTGVVTVRWFGSRQAGTAAPDSDVDILLETKTVLAPAQRDLVLDTSIEMAAAYGRVMDVHYYTSRELRSRRFRATPFINTVLSEGAVI